MARPFNLAPEDLAVLLFLAEAGASVEKDLARPLGRSARWLRAQWRRAGMSPASAVTVVVPIPKE